MSRSVEPTTRPGYVNGVRIIWPEFGLTATPAKKVCINGHVDDFMPSGKCRICRREHNRRYYQDHKDRRNAMARERYAQQKEGA